MRIVIDTNVFVSGIFRSGPPSDILSLWQQKKTTLCFTSDILDEYQRVGQILAKKYSGIDIEPILELVTIHGKIFPNIVLPEPVSRDPDDDKFIACAVSAKAKYIVSGDKDLLDIGSYSKITMIKPKEFLRVMK